MRPQIESGGLHKETGGGGRCRERGGGGGGRKGEKEGGGKCFSTRHHLSPHTHARTAAVSIERTVARQGSNHSRERYKNAFNSGLVLRAERKCLRTKGVDLQLLVLPANLCQPVFLEKNAVSFGKQRSLARPGYEEVLRVTKTLHNGTFLVTRALVLLCERTAVRLATRVCRCWISQTEENKTPL